MTIETRSFAFDGGRRVSAYIPSRPAQILVYCGDGQLIPHWGDDLEAAGLPPTLIVGAHACTDETLRLNDYSPGFDPVRFERHEAFLLREITAWVKADFGVKLPRERTAIFGVSAGGELALALGLRHPEIFGAVFSASPGAGYKPIHQKLNAMPPTYLVAGSQEPFFLQNALEWSNALRGQGTETVMQQRDAGHDDAMWRREFPQMLAWFSSLSD